MILKFIQYIIPIADNDCYGIDDQEHDNCKDSFGVIPKVKDEK
jgi:hypothetical protein